MKLRAFVIVLILTISLTGCKSSQSKSSVTDINIGFFPNITHSQALVGKQTKAFEKNLGENYNLIWTSFNAGPSEVEALLAGHIDIGYIGPVPAINAYAKSEGNIQILSGVTNGGVVLVSNKNTDIKNIKEIENKKIAVPQFGNTQHLSLLKILSDNSLKPIANGGNVDVVQVQNPDIKTLMDREEINLALVPEPWGSRLIDEIDANIVLNYDELWLDGNYSTAVIIASKDFLNTHPEAVKNFLKTHIEITDYINNNPEDAKSIINNQLEEITSSRFPDNILNSSFDRLSITYEPAKKSILEFINLSVEQNFINDIDNKDDIFNFSFLNEILKEKNLDIVE